MSYHRLETIFITIAEKARRVSYNLSTTQPLLISLDSFEGAVKDASEIDRLQLVGTHGYELFQLKKLLTSIKDKKARHFCDQVLSKLLNVNKRSSINISDIFEEFIQGITYFEEEAATLGKPSHQLIYHRLSSCGTGDDAFRRMHHSCIGVSRQEKKRRRKMIETCYIERLIFDRFFTYAVFYDSKKGEPPQQDVGHLDRISLTKTDYKSCFPDEDIEVHLGFTGDIPSILTIIKTKKGIEKNRETYIKTFHEISGWPKTWKRYKYDLFVDAIKTIGDKSYRKFQTFKRESKWVPWIQGDVRSESLIHSTDTDSDDSSEDTRYTV